MQGNFKYPRIKKIHQVLEKIQELIKRPKLVVSCYHMNCCLQKYTTHQFTYFIYYLFQDNFKNAKMVKIQQVHQNLLLQAKTVFIILFKWFSIGDSFEFKVTQET